MPYYSLQEHDSGSAMKFSGEMEQGSDHDPTLVEFHLNETSPGEQLISFENKPGQEIINTMCAAPEVAIPFQERFEHESESIVDMDGAIVDMDGAPPLMDLPLSESSPSEQLMSFESRPDQEMNTMMYAAHDIVVPTQDNFDPEVIAISDDEEEDMRMHEFLVKPSQRPIFPVFRQPRIPFPMAPLNNIGDNSEVITLSDDDDAAKPFHQGFKRKKKSSRRRRPMYNPQECAFCRKESRDNICMAKHLIKHHWHRIRAHNGGNTKGTDYFNLKDDREIPLDREEKRRDEKPHFTPLPPNLPPAMNPTNSFQQRENLVIEQPLKSTFMRNIRPPYSSFPEKADNGSIFDKYSNFSHQDGLNLVKPTGSSDENREVRKDPSEDLGHPDNRKLVQQQLGMLMHAHKCEGRNTSRKQNSFFQENKDCTLPECKNMKEVLKHLPTCAAGTDCMVPKCFISKQIIKWALSDQSPGVLVEMRNELNRQTKAGLPQEVVQWALKHPFEKEQWKSWREKKMPSEPVQSNPMLPGNTLPTTLQNMNNSFMKGQSLSGTLPNTGQPFSNTLPNTLSNTGQTFSNTMPSTEQLFSNTGQPFSSMLPNTGQPNRGNLPNTSPSISNQLKMPSLQKKPVSAELRGEAAKQILPSPIQSMEKKPISDWKKKYIEAAAKRKGNQVGRKLNVPNDEPKTDKVIPSKAPVDFLSGLLSSQSATAELRKVRKAEPIIDKRYNNISKKVAPSPVVKQVTNAAPTTPLQAATSGQEAAMYNSMLSL